jgi:hypothetical protein
MLPVGSWRRGGRKRSVVTDPVVVRETATILEASMDELVEAGSWAETMQHGRLGSEVSRAVLELLIPEVASVLGSMWEQVGGGFRFVLTDDSQSRHVLGEVMMRGWECESDVTVWRRRGAP